jgi:hypothetical protein
LNHAALKRNKRGTTMTTQTVNEIENEFPHGWRCVTKILPNGEQTYDEIPLKPEDFLDPQVGDVFPQPTTHTRCTIEIFNQLDNRYADDLTMVIG